MFLFVSGIFLMGVGYVLLEYFLVGMVIWFNIIFGVVIFSCCGFLLVKCKYSVFLGSVIGFIIVGVLGGLFGGLFFIFGLLVVF